MAKKIEKKTGKTTIVFTLKVKSKHNPPCFDKSGILGEGVLATQEMDYYKSDLKRPMGKIELARTLIDVSDALRDDFIEVTYEEKKKTKNKKNG